MNEDYQFGIIVLIAIILVIGIICVSVYGHKQLKIENFQKTILDLTEEQKCLHICGFQYPNSYFDQYKFCVEKCDRISERNCMKQEDGK